MNTTTNNITKIFYGFLAGNILSGAFGEYNERESATNYGKAVETALTNAYPGVEIEVDWQNADGCLPSSLQPRVYLADGDVQSSGDRGEIETVEQIASKVWESFDWAVGAYTEIIIRPCSGGFGEYEVTPDNGGEAYTDRSDLEAAIHDNCAEVIDLHAEDAEGQLAAAEADRNGDKPKNILGRIHNEPEYVFAVLIGGQWGYVGISRA